MVSKRRNKQAAASKIGNKLNNRLARQGKLNKTAKKRFHKLKKLQKSHALAEKIQKAQLLGNADAEQNGFEDEEDFDEEEDKDYFEASLDSSFVSAATKRARKMNSKDDTEEDYERLPRKQALLEDATEALLPIKTKTRLIAQTKPTNMPDDRQADTLGQEEEMDTLENETKVAEPPPVTSTIELLALRRKTITEKKQHIAILSSNIIENPEKNVKKLKEVRSHLLDHQMPLTVKKVTMLSLLEVFKDIIPGYRMRKLTDREKQQSMKKETKQMTSYEETFLSNYQHYLAYLEYASPGGKKNNRKDLGDVQGLQKLAVRCLCDLLVMHPHFNYTNNIIALLVPLLDHKSHKIVELVSNAVKQIFKTDKRGQVSLEIVRLAARILKSRQYCCRPEMVEIFLSLEISEQQLKLGRDNKKLTKEEKLKLSRRDRKKRKEQEKMEEDLQETQATENQQKTAKLKTEICESLFVIYFQILKRGSDSILLPTALKGIGKFARVISVDYFEDIFGALKRIIESEELPFSELLLCVQTAFHILNSVDYTVNTDHLSFYNFIYKSLFYVDICSSDEDILTLLTCLDTMITQRYKHISQPRIMAFIKRLSTEALHVASPGCLGLIATTRLLLRHCAKGYLLFDKSEMGSGIYLAEITEPEHCNAHNTALWEIHLLKRHYQSLVRGMSQQLGTDKVRPEIINRTPMDILKEYSLEFNQEIDIMPAKNTKPRFNKKQSHGWKQNDLKDLVEKTIETIPDTFVVTTSNVE